MTTDDLSRTPPAQLRRARFVFLLAAVAVPVVFTSIGVAICATWIPEVPDPVVTHWSAGGADGFGPPSTYIWLGVGLGLALPLLMAIITLAAVGAHWGGAARMMGALAAGLSAFAAALTAGSLGIQRGLPDATQAPGIGGVVLLSFTALVVVAAVAWVVQPHVRPERGRTLEPRQAVRVSDGERVVWIATTTMPRAALAGVTVLMLALAALAVYMLAIGVAGAWVVTFAVLVVGAALSTTAAFRVRITPEGLAVRSLTGWPRARIPLEQIDSVRAVDISPFGEFGGWGWRIAVDGRTGIVMRRGAAIEVTRRDGRSFVITIDGAEEAAALLQAYVDAAGRDRAATEAESGEGAP
ncbi:DUF1648 domain-containing protein [Microbacterium aurantiacum]|uniref:DUF1648 domain-containing protein n=1 Tax=Microbacterium aurantiacum TaxID=162393 RepID=UPI000C80F666|nr:DUF1648 domain-containing protein [Microbacterium aurantiacum]